VTNKEKFPELPRYECAANGCEKIVIFPYAMCPGHWSSVSPETRGEDWEACASWVTTRDPRLLVRWRTLACRAIREANAKIAQKSAAA